MKSEKEIKDVLEKCYKVSSFGISKSGCPMEEGEDGTGCCAECSFSSTLEWILDRKNKANANGQERLIDKFKEIVCQKN